MLPLIVLIILVPIGLFTGISPPPPPTHTLSLTLTHTVSHTL